MKRPTCSTSHLTTLVAFLGIFLTTAALATAPMLTAPGSLITLPTTTAGVAGAPATFTLSGSGFPPTGGTVVGKQGLFSEPIDISFDGTNYFPSSTGTSHTFTGSSFSVTVYLRISANVTMSEDFGGFGPVFSADGASTSEFITGQVDPALAKSPTTATTATPSTQNQTKTVPGTAKVAPPPVVTVVNGAAIASALNGLGTGVLSGQAGMAGAHTVLFDVNGHLFNLRNGFDRGENGFVADTGVAPWEAGEGDGGGKDAKSPKEVLLQAPEKRWRVYATENFGSQDLSPIEQQAGIRAESWATSVGAEHMLDHGLILGFATSLLSSEQTYSSGLGNLKLDGPALTGYLSFAPRNTGFWADLLYNWGHYDMDVNRNPGFGFPMAHGGSYFTTNAVQFNTGWNLTFNGGKMTTGPTLGVDYLHGSLGGYSESGGGLGALNLSSQQLDSLVTSIGWQVSRQFETSFGVIIPQLRVGWERENLGDESVAVALQNSPYYLVQGGNVIGHLNRPFQASLDLQQPGRSYAVAGAGVKMNLKNGWNASLDYEAQVLRTGYTQSLAAVRIGFAF